MKNRTYLTKAHIGTIVKGTLLASVLVTSTLMVGCKDNDTETTDAEVVAEADASTEKEGAAAEKNGKATGTTATTATTGNSSTEVESAKTDNVGATTEVARTSDGRQAASTESTSKATGTTASPRVNNSTTETSRANATTEAPKPSNSTTETSKPSNSTTEAPTTPAHTHTWVENTEAVYVPEVGHYEEVMVDPGATWPLYEVHTVCGNCGYDYTADGLHPGAGVHICEDGTTSASYGGKQVVVGEQVIPPTYEKQWVVDTPAHTEQQGNGTYKCSTCGAEKQNTK